MVWRNSEGIYERKTLFWIKKEADQAGFKSTRTGPKLLYVLENATTLPKISRVTCRNQTTLKSHFKSQAELQLNVVFSDKLNVT